MKKIALLISIPFIAVIIAFLVLVLLVNPNDFKPLIKEQVEAQTGRQLTIDGDIEWRFFPTIGFSIGEVALSNPDGFATPDLVKFNNAVLDLNVRPLFQHEINIGLVTLDGASFTLHTLKNGVSNLDNIGPEKVNTDATEATSTETTVETVNTESTKPSTQLNDWKVTLEGIALTNAEVLIQDDKAGTKMYFNDMNLSLSEFSPGEWAKLSFNLKGDLGQQKVMLDGKTDLNIAATLDAASLKQTEFTASYSDASNKFNDITFTIDQFSFDEWANISLKAAGKANALNVNSNSTFALYVPKALDIVRVKDFSSTNNVKGKGIPNEDVTAVISFNSSFDLNKSYLQIEKLALSAVDTDFNGKMNVQLNDIPKVRFELRSPNIDVDALLATLPQSEAASATAEKAPNNKTASATKVKEIEPDLSALKTLDVAGTIIIDKFKANNAKMQNVTSVFSVNRGVLKLTKFRSDLYDGAIDMSATLDARKATPTYSIKQSIKGVKVAPLLTDVMGESLIEGSGNMALNVSGKSLKPSALKQNLKGKASINFADGAVNGVNIPLLIRTTYAKIKGEKVKGSEEAEKTDFSALTADFYLSKGNATTKNIKMVSPLLRIHGEGSANYVNETANMLIKTSIVGTLKGQGGKDIDDLKDVTIPIRITGPWAKPKYKLEFDDVMQQKAKKEIDRGIEKLEEKYGDKIKDEKVKEAANKLLKGLFN